MSIDLSQFIPAFLEESEEGLDLMESSLLNLDGADIETINAIFRAAHSIKGGAGTFGFSHVSEFTHEMETLLDQMRAGDRDVSGDLVNLLLEAVDCLRLLLASAKEGEVCEVPQIQEVHHKMVALLKGEAPSATAETATESASSESANTGWQIEFIAEPVLFKTGNEPMLMFRALEDFGDVTVTANTDKLPNLNDLEPENCYLSWSIILEGECTEEDIREVFEWVEDECELKLSPLGNSEAAADAEPQTAEPEQAEVPVEPAATPVETAETKPSAPGASSATPAKPAASSSASPSTSSSNKKASSKKSSGDGATIRVGIDKVDALINRVGELVITQSMLGQVGRELSDVEHKALEKLTTGLQQLERNTRDLQEDVMRIRMLPISFVFNRFPRMVHDVSSKLGKKVELRLKGEQTEIDKTVMEKIGDPLVHLVRNSLDHGLEMPDERVAAGKDETGTVELNAYHQGGYIVIEITDNGRGLNTAKIQEKAIERGLISADAVMTDQEINELIFMPGFSTAEVVSDLSGRGVGMDVVRRNIESLGGHVSVDSRPGEGSTFSVRLPLTLAILDGQLAKVAGDIYVVPLISIVESIQVSTEEINAIAGRASLYFFRDEYIPLINVREVFALGAPGEYDDGLLVVIENGGVKAGLLVDELLEQQQVVIKSLENNYKRVEGVSGSTILGDGGVALILDVAGMIELALEQRNYGSENQGVTASNHH
ncbi:MAG: chemotaxis protein CheA [Pontibacterium sp.]